MRFFGLVCVLVIIFLALLVYGIYLFRTKNKKILLIVSSLAISIIAILFIRDMDFDKKVDYNLEINNATTYSNSGFNLEPPSGGGDFIPNSGAYYVDLNEYSELYFDMTVYKNGEEIVKESFPLELEKEKGLYYSNISGNGEIKFYNTVIDSDNGYYEISKNISIFEYLDEADKVLFENSGTQTFAGFYNGIDGMIEKGKSYTVEMMGSDSDTNGNWSSEGTDGAVSMEDEMMNMDFYVNISVRFE